MLEDYRCLHAGWHTLISPASIDACTLRPAGGGQSQAWRVVALAASCDEQQWFLNRVTPTFAQNSCKIRPGVDFADALRHRSNSRLARLHRLKPTTACPPFTPHLACISQRSSARSPCARQRIPDIGSLLCLSLCSFNKVYLSSPASVEVVLDQSFSGLEGLRGNETVRYSQTRPTHLFETVQY